MIGIKPPPLWTTMNAVRDYEKAMTDTNTELKSHLFSEDDIDRIKNAKAYVEEAIPDWVKSNAFVVVAGGCFASRMHFEMVKDIDIFVLGHHNPEDQKKMHDAVKRKMQISFPTISDKNQNYPRNNDAVKEVWNEDRKKIQYIFTSHKSREDRINDFDYVHCMTSYHLGSLYITLKIFDEFRDRKLKVQYPKNHKQWRKCKFSESGYIEFHEDKQKLSHGAI